MMTYNWASTTFCSLTLSWLVRMELRPSANASRIYRGSFKLGASVKKRS